MVKKKMTVALDFDGVIHSYFSGYQGPETIADPPVDGIKETIEELRSRYRVAVVSSRCLHEEGKKAIINWLKEHDIRVDEVTGEKQPALVYVDDRALTFDGDAYGLIEKIRHFKPWHKQ